MRVAFVTFEYPPVIIGGAGTYAINLVDELANLGHEVYVFTAGRGPQLEEHPRDKVWVVRVGTSDPLPYRALQFWINLPGTLRRYHGLAKFDMVHFNGLSYWFLRRRIVKNARYVATIHHPVSTAARENRIGIMARLRDISGENGLLLPLIERRCVASVDRIVAASEYTGNLLGEIHRIRPDGIRVIYNGINGGDYSYAPGELEELRKKYGLPDGPVVLFVGRCDDPRKGLDLLLNNAGDLMKTTDAILVIIGSGDQRKGREIVAKGDFADRVFFTGFVDDATLRKFYALCAVYVTTSRLEGFGLTIIDAMAAGKPVVATRVGSIPELIADGENGFLLGLDDLGGLSSAVRRILSDRDLTERMAGNNRVRARAFTWKECAAQVGAMYKELKQEAARGA